jgi:flagellar biosynthesis protein FlhB
VSDDSKTQKPTPKRIKEFRKKGEIARSPDLAGTASLLGGVVCLMATSGSTATSLSELMRACAAALSNPDQAKLLVPCMAVFVKAVIPAGIGAMLGFAIGACLQLGWPPTFKKPGFDLGKLFSLQAIGGALSPKQGGGRVLKAMAKTAGVCLVVWIALRAELDKFLTAPALEAAGLARQTASGAGRVAMGALFALAVLAAFDYLIARRRLTKKMMMSPEEVKREHREQEGDPLVRGRRRRRMRELARRRVSAEVKSADVVLVNPTEYAVALRYDAEEGRAPRVVAKGRRAAAAHIRELARKAGVPILVRPPLTRLIFKLVPEGREIPGQLYQAVAEVLAYVYRLRERRR